MERAHVFYELHNEKKVAAPIHMVRNVIRNDLLENGLMIETDEPATISFRRNPFSGSRLDVFAAVSYGKIEFVGDGVKTIVRYKLSLFWILIITFTVILITLTASMVFNGFRLTNCILIVSVWGVLYFSNLIMNYPDASIGVSKTK